MDLNPFRDLDEYVNRLNQPHRRTARSARVYWWVVILAIDAIVIYLIATRGLPSLGS